MLRRERDHFGPFVARVARFTAQIGHWSYISMPASP